MMELKAGDYIALEGVSEETLKDVISKFDKQGFKNISDIDSRYNWPFFGAYGNSQSCFGTPNDTLTRRLTVEQVLGSADEWIEWNGGSCPVEASVVVEAKLRGSEPRGSRKAGDYNWRHGYGNGEIVAYRIAESDHEEPLKVDSSELYEKAISSIETSTPMHELYPAYYRGVSKLESVDFYRLAELFGITDANVAHAFKKLLLAGDRTGNKSFKEDIKEARDTLTRRLDMWAEDD